MASSDLSTTLTDVTTGHTTGTHGHNTMNSWINIATRPASTQTITHSTSGALTIDANDGHNVIVDVEEDITSVVINNQSVGLPMQILLVGDGANDWTADLSNIQIDETANLNAAQDVLASDVHMIVLIQGPSRMNNDLWAPGGIQSYLGSGTASFPSIEEVTTGEDASGSSSGTFAMHSAIDADDMLVLVTAWGGNQGTPVIGSVAGTWTKAVDLAVAGEFQQLVVWILRADGSEDSVNETWTSGGSAGTKSSTWALVRISGAYASGGSGTAWDVATGPATNTVNPDPPNVVASWGTTTNLYIAVAMAAFSGATFTDFPAGYTLNQTQNEESGITVALAATNDSTGDSNNPGTFTHDDAGGENTGTATLVFRPE